MVMELQTRNLKCGAPFPIPLPSVELECVEFHSEIHLEFKMQAHCGMEVELEFHGIYISF